MAEHVTFWDYDPEMSVTCRHCGWTGHAGDHQDLHREVLDVRCTVCDTMLLIVAYPTLAETRDAAAAGDERARADLSKMQEHEAWHERQRYGSRLAGVRPTPVSEMWLYGDRLSAPDVIDRLNASLRADSAMNDEGKQ